MKLKAVTKKDHDCVGCIADTYDENDCIDISYQAGVQGLTPCVRSKLNNSVIYVEDKEGNKDA